MEEVNMQQSLSTPLDVWVVGHCGPIQEMWEKFAISSQDQSYKFCSPASFNECCIPRFHAVTLHICGSACWQ